MGSYLARATGGYDATHKKDQTKATLIYSISYADKRIYYQTRSLFNTESAPAFTMTDRESSPGSTSYYTALTSLPMYAKYAERQSIRETSFERVLVLMKDPLNKKHVNSLVTDIREALSDNADASLKVYSYLDSFATVEKV